ncbi:MAG: TetR family transcriptional regulator [Mycobacteriales bacterium]
MSEPSADGSPEVPRAVDGRVPGRRGQVTRQRLLDATVGLLRSTNYRDIKVIDIARAAGTSPATFYQYFPDIESAILLLAEQMAQQGRDRLPALITDQRWRGQAGGATARRLVDGVVDFWEENQAVLRVVDLATEEGDLRFRGIRVRMLNSVTTALAEVIEGLQRDGRYPATVDPMAMAGALVSMLAHVAAHRYGFEFWGIRIDDLRTAMTRLVCWGVSGQRPAGG